MAGRIWAREGPAGFTRATLCWSLRWKFRASPWKTARRSTLWRRALPTRLRAGQRRFVRPTWSRRIRVSGHDAALALVVSGRAASGRGDCRDLPADFAAQHPAGGKIAAAQRRTSAAGIDAAHGAQSKRPESEGEIILGVGGG